MSLYQVLGPSAATITSPTKLAMKVVQLFTAHKCTLWAAGLWTQGVCIPGTLALSFKAECSSVIWARTLWAQWELMPSQHPHRMEAPAGSPGGRLEHSPSEKAGTTSPTVAKYQEK